MSHSGLYWNRCARSGRTASTLKGEVWKPVGSNVSNTLLRPCHWLLVNGVGPLVKSASDSREHGPASPIGAACRRRRVHGRGVCDVLDRSRPGVRRVKRHVMDRQIIEAAERLAHARRVELGVIVEINFGCCPVAFAICGASSITGLPRKATSTNGLYPGSPTGPGDAVSGGYPITGSGTSVRCGEKLTVAGKSIPPPSRISEPDCCNRGRPRGRRSELRRVVDAQRPRRRKARRVGDHVVHLLVATRTAIQRVRGLRLAAVLLEACRALDIAGPEERIWPENDRRRPPGVGAQPGPRSRGRARNQRQHTRHRCQRTRPTRRTLESTYLRTSSRLSRVVGTQRWQAGRSPRFAKIARISVYECQRMLL